MPGAAPLPGGELQARRRAVMKCSKCGAKWEVRSGKGTVITEKTAKAYA